MWLTLGALALGLVIGLLRGGSLRWLARRPVYWTLLLIVGLAIQTFVEWSDPPGAVPMLIGSYAILLLFVLRNLQLAGMGVVAIGLAANLVPIALNEGMPVRAESLVIADIIEAEELERADLTSGRHFENPDDILPVLGDVIPIPWVRTVVSFGDLIVLIGLAAVTANLLLNSGRTLEIEVLDLDALSLDLRDHEPDDLLRAPAPTSSTG